MLPTILPTILPTMLPTILMLVGSMDMVAGQARLLLLLEDSQMDLQTR